MVGVVLLGDMAATRAVMRGLVLGGQRRVHLTKESDPRRRSIAAAICETGCGRLSTTPAAATAVNSMPAEHACTRWSFECAD